MAKTEYDFYDDDKTEEDIPIRTDPLNATSKGSGSRGSGGDGLFAKRTPDLGAAITAALGSGKFQRYPTTSQDQLRPDLNLPRLRPKDKLPDPADAFDWAVPDGAKRPKKKPARDITGLSRKQQKTAVGLPGMAPLFDFLNVYRHRKGGWR